MFNCSLFYFIIYYCTYLIEEIDLNSSSLCKSRLTSYFKIEHGFDYLDAAKMRSEQLQASYNVDKRMLARDTLRSKFYERAIQASLGRNLTSLGEAIFRVLLLAQSIIRARQPSAKKLFKQQTVDRALAKAFEACDKEGPVFPDPILFVNECIFSFNGCHSEVLKEKISNFCSSMIILSSDAIIKYSLSLQQQCLNEVFWGNTKDSSDRSTASKAKLERDSVRKASHDECSELVHSALESSSLRSSTDLQHRLRNAIISQLKQHNLTLSEYNTMLLQELVKHGIVDNSRHTMQIGPNNVSNAVKIFHEHFLTISNAITS